MNKGYNSWETYLNVSVLVIISYKLYSITESRENMWDMCHSNFCSKLPVSFVQCDLPIDRMLFFFQVSTVMHLAFCYSSLHISNTNEATGSLRLLEFQSGQMSACFVVLSWKQLWLDAEAKYIKTKSCQLEKCYNWWFLHSVPRLFWEYPHAFFYNRLDVLHWIRWRCLWTVTSIFCFLLLLLFLFFFFCGIFIYIFFTHLFAFPFTLLIFYQKWDTECWLMDQLAEALVLMVFPID